MVAKAKKVVKKIKKLTNFKPKKIKQPDPEVYFTNDLILPDLELLKPVEITVRFNDKVVQLQVGPRDWTWSRKTKEMIAAGTNLPEVTSDVEVTEQVPEVQN